MVGHLTVPLSVFAVLLVFQMFIFRNLVLYSQVSRPACNNQCNPPCAVHLKHCRESDWSMANRNNFLQVA